MAYRHRRKCKCCLKLFRPDPRNHHHQRYCSAPNCRAASKADSHARWLAKPENADYFRGPANVVRVQTWRAIHPGYWRKSRRVGPALQDLLRVQPIDIATEITISADSPLQEVLLAQPAVSIGLTVRVAVTRCKMTLPAPRTDCYDGATTFSPHPLLTRRRQPRLTGVVHLRETYANSRTV